jgi:hypothetical protein
MARETETLWLLRIGVGIISLSALAAIGAGMSLSGTLATIETDMGWTVKHVEDLTTEQKSMGKRLTAIETNTQP